MNAHYEDKNERSAYRKGSHILPPKFQSLTDFFSVRLRRFTEV